MQTENENIAGKKIFLVEDDLFFANMISDKITRAGGILLHSPDGEKAMEEIEKELPDVFLLDLLLPGKIDGFGVLERIKKNIKLKDKPVLIISNLSQPEDIERGMKLGAFRYLVKSNVTPSEIIEHLANTLNAKIK